MTFNECNKVYPLRIIRPNNKYKYDEQLHIKEVLNDINKNSCYLYACVLDKPKRSTAKLTLGHSSSFACEYCEGQAIQTNDAASIMEIDKIKKKYSLRRQNIQNTIDFLKESPGSVKSKEKDNEKITDLMKVLDQLKSEEEKNIKNMEKRKHLAWPFSTMNATLRTNDLIRYTVNKIERTDGDLDKSEKKGIKGRSHFLQQPNFNFIDQIPAEYMHLGCLGVVKRLLQLTFDTGETRIKTSKRKLSETTHFNNAMKKIKSFREFSRRCRNLDLSVIKAQEYRNIILFFFNIVIDCIETAYPKEKIIWLCLAFMLRACILPNKEFECIELINIKNVCKKFYYLFDKCFGPNNCSYSVHVLASHLLRIRGDNPLTHRSAFVFESFYSEMKNLFRPGTVSPLKQILTNTVMKRSLEHHTCSKPIRYDIKKLPNTGMENNSMIYIFDRENEKHFFYNIIEILENDSFLCTEQGKFVYENELTPEINWSSVGVYKVGPGNLNTHTINKKDIDGKVLKVENLLITCPINVLEEQ